ncbi:MAG: prepilin-type N-terminal cleavage/methylation domain-containing protein [bacterium]|nr:prepilin-type N-terminal cleavage/methylation domain-containing protein [bacterium]
MRTGFSLIEVLIIVAILGLLLVVGYFYMAPNMARGRDGKRISDLNKLKIVFEDYYNDNSCYPPINVLELYCGGAGSTILDEYINQVPCDPETLDPYAYSVLTGDDVACPVMGYRVHTNLERDNSDASQAINCGGVYGCGFGVDGIVYDYGIAQGAAVSLYDAQSEEIAVEEPAEEDPTEEVIHWCCALSTQTCTDITATPTICEGDPMGNQDNHGPGSYGACLANCVN